MTTWRARELRGASDIRISTVLQPLYLSHTVVGGGGVGGIQPPADSSRSVPIWPTSEFRRPCTLSSGQLNYSIHTVLLGQEILTYFELRVYSTRIQHVRTRVSPRLQCHLTAGLYMQTDSSAKFPPVSYYSFPPGDHNTWLQNQSWPVRCHKRVHSISSLQNTTQYLPEWRNTPLTSIRLRAFFLPAGANFKKSRLKLDSMGRLITCYIILLC
jgi:hypothetical protein